MKQIKLIMKSVFICTYLSFSYAYAAGTAICPPVNTLQCTAIDPKYVVYSSTSTPGDWKSVPVWAPCGSLASASFMQGAVYYPWAVNCAYIIPGSGNKTMTLVSKNFKSYIYHGNVCNRSVVWHNPLAQFDYSVACNTNVR